MTTTQHVRDFSATSLKASAIEFILSFYPDESEEVIKKLASFANGLRYVDIDYDADDKSIIFSLALKDVHGKKTFGSELEDGVMDWVDDSRWTALSALLREDSHHIFGLVSGLYNRLYIGFGKVGTIIRLTSKTEPTIRYQVPYGASARKKVTKINNSNAYGQHVAN